MTNICAQCGRTYDPENHHDCADRAAFTHGLDLLGDPLAGKIMYASVATEMAANLAKATAEAIIDRVTPWLRHELGCRGQYGDPDLCTCGLADALGGLADRIVPERPPCACGFPDRHTNLPCNR